MSTRKRSTARLQEDQVVYVPLITCEETPGTPGGAYNLGVYTDKWAANLALLEHEGYLSNCPTEEIVIRFDKDELISVVGVLGEGDPIDWRVEKHVMNHTSRSAGECNRLAQQIVDDDETDGTIEREEQATKRTKTS